jgi:pilus assembly protein CpaF
MFTILIQEKGGEQRRMVFNKTEVTIGRVQGNDVVLAKGNVSKRHARVVLKDSKFIIVDLKSTNGTYVNGRKITSPLVVKNSDKIYIGDFIVGVDEASGDGEGPSEITTSPPTPHVLGQLDSDALRAGEPGGETSLSPIVAPAPRPVPPRPAPGNVSRDNAGPRTRDLGSAAPMAPSAARPSVAPAAPGRTIGGPPAPAGVPPLAPVPPPPPGAMSSPAESPALAPIVQMPERADRHDRAPQGDFPRGAPQGDFLRGADKPAGRLAPAATAGTMKLAARSVSAAIKRSVHLDPLDPKVVKQLDLQARILESLNAKLVLDSVPLAKLGEEELWQKAERLTIDLVEGLEGAGELPKYIDQDALIKDSLNEALGLGPLEDLLADETVDEILIDRRDRMVIGAGGVLRGSGKAFSSEDVLERVVKRLVHEAGTSIDSNTPIVDVRMRDGTRLTAALPPVAARGPCLVLKKPAQASPALAELVQSGVLSSGMAAFLATCIVARRNILVCGGPGSGRAVVVAALAAAAPAGERLVSVEDVAELAIARDEWIQLEARIGTSGSRDIDMATLLETALRLSPDRLVVGDVRGREATVLVHTLSAYADGAVVSVAGDGVNAALNRLAVLVRATAAGGNDLAYRELVGSAFDIAVHVVRRGDGAMKIQSIEEMVSVSEANFDTQTLFSCRENGFIATGTVPRFYSELEASGVRADRSVFR